MKKLLALLLALAMCLSLASCGGPDKQPAIDAHSSAVKVVNEVSALLSENSDRFEDYTTEVNTAVDTLDEYGEKLHGDDDLSQDELDKIIEYCNQIEEQFKEAKAEIEGILAG